jgi:hypothetical protein
MVTQISQAISVVREFLVQENVTMLCPQETKVASLTMANELMGTQFD